MSAHDTITRQHRFTVTPEHLIFDPRVSDRAVRLWMRLDRYAGERESAMPYREMLCVDLDCSLATVDRAIEELVHAGWLVKEWVRSANRNKYTLIVAPQDQVMVLVEAAREARRERWGNQRKPSEGQSSPMRSPHPRRQQSSPMTTRVLTHDAQKEATKRKQQKEAPGATAPGGEQTAFDINVPPPPQKPVHPNQRVAAAVWEHTHAMVNFKAVLSVAGRALRLPGATEDAVIRAMNAVYDAGRPITMETIGQYMSGRLNGRATPANGVPNPIVRPDGSVDADAILGKDVWSVPLPPEDIADALADDMDAYQAWKSARIAEHLEERQEEAKRVLRVRGVVV